MYLSKQNLDNLKLYKYSSVDKSLVSRYILRPYWTWFLTLFPKSMAPNLITLSGLGFVLANVATLLYYDPMLRNGVPSWVYASWAVGLWLYQSFDSIDGMQARRTGQSSPLGEMFDHGCDAINTTLEVILTCATLNLHQSWWALVCQFATICNFYLTTWEEYHTGTLYLSAFSGPVEGILMVIGLHLISAVYGPEVWDTLIFEAIGMQDTVRVLPSWLSHMEFKHLFLYFGGLGLCFNIFGSSVHVIAARRKANLSLTPALSGLLPFFASSATTALFAYLNPTVVEDQCLPYMLFIGTLLAFSVGLLITAHVTHAPFPYFKPYFLLAPIACGILLDAHVGPYEAKSIVWLSLGLAIGVYGGFVVDVITDITHHLDIYCLSIKHKRE